MKIITFSGYDKFPSLRERLLHERKLQGGYLERLIYEQPVKSEPFIENQREHTHQNYLYINLFVNRKFITKR